MAYQTTSNRLANEMDIKNRTGLAIRFMLDAIHAESTPFTPKRHGPLRDTVVKRVQDTSGTIIWTRKYASRMEKKQFENYTTPGTGPHFAENAVKMVTDQSQMYFIKAGINGR